MIEDDDKELKTWFSLSFNMNDIEPMVKRAIIKGISDALDSFVHSTPDNEREARLAELVNELEM